MTYDPSQDDDPFQEVRKLPAPPRGFPPGEYYVVELKPWAVLGPVRDSIRFYRTPDGRELLTWDGERIAPGDDSQLFEVVKAEVDYYDATHPE
jgi:hypothetical protein